MDQRSVRQWFESTYASEGLEYLRPAAFYARLLRHVDLRPGQRLLDVGCGPGLLLAQAGKLGLEAYGIDLSEVALGAARSGAPGARIAASNAEALCFRDDSFDLITCIGVLEHFVDPDRALAEMRRVARGHAQIAMLVPNSRSLRRKLHMPKTASGREEERVGTLEEWSRMFAEAGFAIERVHRDEWVSSRLRRFLPGSRMRLGRGGRRRHLLPLKYASQFVFILRV